MEDESLGIIWPVPPIFSSNPSESERQNIFPKDGAWSDGRSFLAQILEIKFCNEAHIHCSSEAHVEPRDNAKRQGNTG